MTPAVSTPLQSQPADEELTLRAAEALRSSPYLTGRQLRLESRHGQLTLRGHVLTFFQKQMAQESLRHVEGVAQIDNQLEVL